MTSRRQYADAVAVFTGSGWAAGEWEDLHEHYLDLALRNPSAKATVLWLEDPPRGLKIPVSPAGVKDMFARHGGQAPRILTELAHGISERFTLIFLERGMGADRDIKGGWLHAMLTGLPEPEATGWAVTGYLDDPHRLSETGPQVTDIGWTPKPRRDVMTDLIDTWYVELGPDAYLWVLAGIDLDEAVAMRDAGQSPGDQELRVMAVLNGHTLPAGI